MKVFKAIRGYIEYRAPIFYMKKLYHIIFLHFFYIESGTYLSFLCISFMFQKYICEPVKFKDAQKINRWHSFINFDVFVLRASLFILAEKFLNKNENPSRR